jgi:hypothetical protein
MSSRTDALWYFPLLAFADAIVDTPSILQQLSQGPAYTAKAFFASTCLAILEVSLTRVGAEGVRVVQMGRGAPKIIGIAETPGMQLLRTLSLLK